MCERATFLVTACDALVTEGLRGAFADTELCWIPSKRPSKAVLRFALNVRQGLEVNPSTGGEGARSDLKRSAQGPTATLNPLIHDGRQPPSHQDAE